MPSTPVTANATIATTSANRPAERAPSQFTAPIPTITTNASTVSVSNSILSGNSANFFGGGIFNAF
ncbi:MAG: hypothetical protein HC888_09670 [Candidatus Competibacteraceae bacterium]|nr:hypothetical protein [Candidatus Competibacteraceae bacterium]